MHCPRPRRTWPARRHRAPWASCCSSIACRRNGSRRRPARLPRRPCSRSPRGPSACSLAGADWPSTNRLCTPTRLHRMESEAHMGLRRTRHHLEGAAPRPGWSKKDRTPPSSSSSPRRRAPTRTMQALSLNGHRGRERGDSVRDDDERARARLHAGSDVEERRDRRATGRDAHRGVVVRAGVEDVARRVVGDPHQRVVGRALVVIAIRARLREAVELRALDNVRGAPRHGRWWRRERRRPRGVRASRPA